MAKITKARRIFITMPFTEDCNDVYSLGVEDACRKAGTSFMRSDDTIYTSKHLERIQNEISKSDVVIADLTDRDPNVIYATGFANALGKRLILLSKDSKDVPLDLMHSHQHFIYGGRIRHLKSQLEHMLTRDFEIADNKYDVFLSYSSSDESMAQKIVENAEMNNIRVFFSPNELMGGDPFNNEIRQALINAFEIWVLITKNSLGSEWVATEWGAGWVLNKRVVPILFECSTDQLPQRLGILQCVEYDDIGTLNNDFQHRLKNR